MKTHTTLLVAAILTSLSTYTQAQQTNDDIETITVLGTPAPVSLAQIAGAVTVIDQARIEASGAIGISDLLRTVAGVNIGKTGSGGSLSEVRFRGSESNHVLVLIDGVQINDGGQGGLTDFSHILLANIERIEILRGPQSAIWGSAAIAGIISITTKQATSSKLEGSASVAVGDRGTTSANVNIAQQQKQLGYSINASTFNTDGENTSRTGNEADGYENNSISGGVNYRFDAFNRIDFTARILNFTNDNDGFDFATGLVGDANNVAKGDQLSLGINWHFAPTDNGNKRGIYSQLLTLQYSRQDTDNFTDGFFGSASTGENLRVLWSNRFEFTSNKWINIGLESRTQYFKQRGAGASNGINQSESNDSWSVVTDGLYALSDTLNLTASYRYDNNDIFDNASSYRIGVTYALSNDWRIFVSEGKAIKNPTFIERFGFFPNSFVGNANLTPEQQKSTEVGIEGSFTHFTVQANWFNARLEDEILGFVFLPDSGQFTADNAIIDSKREGIELSAQGQFDKFNWNAQYSYLDASQGNSAELRRARHTGSISTTYTLNEQHQVYLQADYAGTKLDNFFPPLQAAQQVSLDSYWLVSANYQYTYNASLSVNVRLSNAFNADYEDVFGFNTDGSRALLSLNYAW